MAMDGTLITDTHHLNFTQNGKMQAGRHVVRSHDSAYFVQK